MTFEELKKEFKDNGFKIDGDSFILERTQYSTININGQIIKQPHTTRFEMRFVFEGILRDLGESENEAEPLFEFDVIGDDGNPADTICIKNFEDFVSLC